MACFMKFFKAQKSFDLPVFDSVPGTISKVIILHNLTSKFYLCNKKITTIEQSRWLT